MFQLGRIAQNNLLAVTEVLREVESEPIFLPIVCGTNQSETGGAIVKSNWET